MDNARYAPILRLLIILVVAPFINPAYSQQAPTGQDLDRSRIMLKAIKDDLKNNYYDPAYHGMDLESRFKAAEIKLKQAASLGQLFGIIAQVLIDLHDSHTFLIPPGRAVRTEYGWQMQFIGNKTLVVSVKPGSDAEAKGLRPGDEVVSVDNIAFTRENIWVFEYLYRTLRPRPGMHIIALKPDGKEARLDVLAKVEQKKRIMDLTDEGGDSDIWDLIREDENESRLHRHRYVEMGADAIIWKMPAFDLEKNKVDEMGNKLKTRKGVILDLRGNAGGAEETLLRLIGNLFDRDVKVGDLKTRKEGKPLVAKTRGENAFAGKLIVLIDSNSGSAAELLARVVQLEKRGIVIGDVSAGAVMRARHFDHQLGADIIVPYGVSITDADIIMTDGKSLEHVGVTPDETKVPTPADLAAKRDPVLAYATSLLGLVITPEKAGALFPLEWRK
jgi:C-terminal processing protease CtpA/Prc